MDRQFDSALFCFRSSTEKELDKARVFFKQGQVTQAFQEYCSFVHTQLIEWGENEPYGRVFADHVRNTIMCKYSFETLCPFKNYGDFLSFMELEYAKAGPEEQEKYRDAMKLFRGIAFGGTAPH